MTSPHGPLRVGIGGPVLGVLLVPGLLAAGIDVIDGEYIDPLKLVILLSSSGADGNKVEADLLAANIDVEMANRDIVIPMITFADTPDRIDDLI